MHAYQPPNARSRRYALPLVASAGFLLAACAGNNVVVEPVALKPVDARLMKAPGIPRCDLPNRADYAPAEVIVYAKCWEAAYHSIAARHIGLQRAVRAREQIAAKAVKASKGS